MIQQNDIEKILSQCNPQAIYSAHSLIISALETGCFDGAHPKTLNFRQKAFLNFFSEAIPKSHRASPDAWRFDFGKLRPGFKGNVWAKFLGIPIACDDKRRTIPPWQWLNLKKLGNGVWDSPNWHLAFLSDLPRKARPTYYKLRQLEKRYANQHSTFWCRIGAAKLFSRWVVAPNRYRLFLGQPHHPDVCRVDSHWQANDLIHQPGRFYLSKACKKLPFNQNQLRYLGRKEKNAKHTLGIWKDKVSGRWLIDMPVFKKWVLHQKFPGTTPNP